MERGDVSEVQDFWNFDEGQTGGKWRSNEIRRFLLFQVSYRITSFIDDSTKWYFSFYFSHHVKFSLIESSILIINANILHSWGLANSCMNDTELKSFFIILV